MTVSVIKLDGTQRAAVNGYASFDLLVWKLHQCVSMPSYTWSDSGKISSNSYEDIVFKLFWGHCLLWPWPFDPKIQLAHLWTQTRHWPQLGEIPFVGFSDFLILRTMLLIITIMIQGISVHDLTELKLIQKSRLKHKTWHHRWTHRHLHYQPSRDTSWQLQHCNSLFLSNTTLLCYCCIQ